jgi:hypothetical protein
MSKNRTRTAKSPFPSYAQALAAMRQRAESDVHEAITRASSSLPEKVARQVPSGTQAYNLFDGIIGALAQRIITEACTGHERQMAQLVANMLISKVEALGCQGRA